MRLKTTNTAWLLFLLSMLFLIFPAHAAHADTLTGGGAIDRIQSIFKEDTAAWRDVIMREAKWLYWTLATISFIWTFGLMAIQKSDAGDIFVELVKYIMFTGIFWWLLQNGPAFANDIIDSLTTLATQASGGSKSFEISTILDLGMDILHTSIHAASFSISGFFGVLMSLIVLIVFVVISVEVLVLYVSAYFVAYAGIILLGFGGAKWTNEIAINYYRKILALGIELMAMVLIVGIGQKMIHDFYANSNLADGFQIDAIIAFLIAAIALLLIAQKIPALLASIVPGGGGGSGGFGALSATASMAIGAAAGAAGGMKVAKMMGSAGLGAVGAAAAHAGGVAKTVGAATSMAMQQPTKHVPDLTAKIADNLVKGAAKEARSMGGKAMSVASGMASKAHNAMNSTIGGRVASHIRDENFTGPRRPNGKP